MSTLNLGQAELIRSQMEQQHEKMRIAKLAGNTRAARHALAEYRRLSIELAAYTPKLGFLAQANCKSL